MARLFLQNWRLYLPDIAVLAVVFAALLLHKRREGWRRNGLRALFFVYLTGVLWVTVLPVLSLLPCSFHYAPMELRPFFDLKQGYGNAARQLALNVVMTIPFGLLYPPLRKRSFFATTVATLVLSLTIELVQPLLPTARTADITDVICNAAGGIVGYILYRLFRPLFSGAYR